MISRLDSIFSHSFVGVIWNLVIEPQKKILILEVRDEMTRKVYFSALYYESGQFLWKDRSYDDWWVSVVGVQGDKIFFQRFDHRENPEKKRFFAADLHDFRICWSIEGFSFQEMGVQIVGSLPGKELGKVYLNVNTGVQEPSSGSDYERIEDPVIRPHAYLEESTYFDTVVAFLENRIHAKIVMGVEYLEYNNRIVISYYIEESGDLVNYLSFFDKEGQLLVQEKIADAVKGFGQDTFFLLSGCLFFVRNRNEIICCQWV